MSDVPGRPLAATVTRRWRTAFAAALIAGLVIISIAAVTAPGLVRSKVVMGDTGMWQVDRSRARVGHINGSINEVDAELSRPEWAGVALTIEQADLAITVVDSAHHLLWLVDDRLGQLSNPVSFPAGAQILADAGRLAIVDGVQGRVWLFDESLPASGADLAGVPPTVTLAAGSIAAIGLDGTLHLAAAGSSSVGQIDPHGRVTSQRAPNPFESPMQITAVGKTTAVIDTERGVNRLTVANARGVIQRTVPGPTLGTVQIPGPDAPGVVLAGGGNVTSVAFADASVSVAASGFPDDLLGPAVLGPCMVTASPRSGEIASRCRGTAWRRSTPLVGGHRLRMRIVHDRIWVDDLDGSDAARLSADEVSPGVTRWSDLVNLANGEAGIDSRDGGGRDVTGDGDGAADGTGDPAENEAPTAHDDAAVIRPNRSSVVPVLANDTDPDDDPLRITRLVGVPPDASVELVSDATALRIRAARGPFSFRYEASDGGPGHVTGATVDITVDDLANKPPVVRGERISAKPGSQVEIDLLSNDADPEGDGMSLVVGDLSPTVGAVSSFAEGTVEILTAPRASGLHTLLYRVIDDRGAATAGKLELDVSTEGDNAPRAADDVVVVVQGREISFDPRVNDRDPDGDPLSVTGIPTALPVGNIVFGPGGAGRLTATTLGTSVVRYTLSDGARESSASIRFDVVAPGRNRPPAPIDDRVLIQQGRVVHVEPLGNDSDPDGVVLSLSSWTADPTIAVEPTGSAGFTVGVAPDFTSAKISYTVTDGVESSEAEILVRGQPVGPNQAPVAHADSTRVRVGVARSLDVRSNDIDPENGTLSVVSATSGDPASVGVTVSGDQVRVHGRSAKEGAVEVTYVVRDAEGASAKGTLFVSVIGDGAPNRGPVALPDVARAVLGNAVTVPVLANDADPDGDLLTVIDVGRVPGATTRVSADLRSVIVEQDSPVPGTMRFSYTVTDDLGSTSSATVSVGMFPEATLNRPPVARADSYTVVAGSGETILDVLTNDVDPDGDPITLESVTGAEGAPVISGSRIRFSAPPRESIVPVQFQYVISDGQGGAGTGNVSVLVLSLRSGIPKAVDDVFRVQPGSVSDLDVLRNDSDADGAQRDLRVLSVDGHGLSVSPDRRGVRVQAGARGTRGTYSVSDADNRTAVASIQVIIVAVGTQPVSVAPTVPRSSLVQGRTVRASPPSTTTSRRSVATTEATARPTAASTQSSDLRIRATDDDVSIRPGSTLIVDPLANDDPAGRLVVVGVESPGRITSGGAKVEITLPRDLKGTLELRYTVELRNQVPPVRATAVIRVRATGLPPQMSPPVAAARRSTVVVSWAVPQSTSPVDLYEVRVSGDSGSARQTAGTDLTLNDLPGGRAYRFEVRARSADGWGDWSDPSSSVVVRQRAAALPAPVVRPDDGRLLISWTPSSGDAQRYRLSIVGTTEVREVTAPNTSYAWEGLTNGKGYSFVVVVENEAGDSEPSAASAVAKPAAKPGAPVSLTAVLVAKRQVRVRWQAASDNGSAVLKFVLSGCGSADLRPDVFETISSVSSTKGLVCRLVAVNAVGPGPEATAVVLAQGAIGTPEAPRVTRGDAKSTLTWPEPDSSADIDGYRVETDASLGTKTTTTAALVWSPLTNGSTYRFRVRALSDGEEGPWSEFSLPVTPAGKPTVPRKVTALPTAVTGRVALAWQVPTDTGGVPISEYRYRCSATPSEPTVQAMAGPVTVAVAVGEPLRAWSCAVMAINAAGLSSDVAPVDINPADGPPTAAPTGLIAGSAGGAVTLRWTPPASGWSPYQYTVSRTGAADSVVLGTSIELKGLSVGVPIALTVTGTSALGVGPAATLTVIIPAPTTTTTTTLPSTTTTTIPPTTTTSTTIPPTTVAPTTTTTLPPTTTTTIPETTTSLPPATTTSLPTSTTSAPTTTSVTVPTATTRVALTPARSGVR